jgi:hypothetical protein
MKINLKTCSEEELWKYIGTELARNEIDVILVGGAVVSIYSEGAYQSGDLDFVINDFSRVKLREVLSNLGFHQGGRHFKHPDCKHLYLEFATFPASIGDDYNITPAEVKHDGQLIKIFSPTDCVRDRLASFAYFNARECLDQAIMVAKKHPVNFEKIKKWCEEERILNEFDTFLIEFKK